MAAPEEPDPVDFLPLESEDLLPPDDVADDSLEEFLEESVEESEEESEVFLSALEALL